MSATLRVRVSLAACALLGALVCLVSAQATTRRSPVPAEQRVARPAAPDANLHIEVRVRSEVLWNGGHPEQSLAYLDSVAASGRAAHDPALVLAARLWRTRRMVTGEQYAATTALLDTLDREALALHAAEARAWILCSRALVTNGTDAPHAGDAWRRAAEFAHAHGLAMVEFSARWSCGEVLNYQGRYAEAIAELGKAKPLPVPDDFVPRILLPMDYGQALSSLGRYDEARREFQDGIERCKSQNRPEYVRYYVNDLAVLEYNENDPAAALPWLEQVLALPRAFGDSVRTQAFQLSWAWTVYRIGPRERGLAELRPLEAACEITGNPTNLTTIHSYLAEAYSDGGEYEASLRHARRAFEFASRGTADSRMYAANSLARAQRLSGQLENALATLDSALLDHPQDRRASDLLDSRMVQIDLLIRLGRLAEAERIARAADRQARPDGPLKGANWQEVGTLLARVHRMSGRPDSALAQLRRVRLDWERRRDTITREEWRENRDASSGPLFAELGLTLLDPHRHLPERLRTRQAFDALQEFQARTLEERMNGAGASARAMAHRITIDSLQRTILLPDEMLLDIVATPDTTFAFAVTRGEVRYRPLPGTRLLGPRVERLMPAMEAAHEGDGPEAALGWLAAAVLTPFADMLASHPRIVVSGGGPLALLPWAALPGPDGNPLLAGHEVVVAPSATLWANERASASTAGKTHLLVLGRTTGADGRTLGAVQEECRAVERYAGVTSRVHAGNRALKSLVADMDRYDAIHLAAHMYSDNMNPWRSGVLMGRGKGDDAYLRASDIARRRLAARLVVLSGCQSAAARSLPGEGPQGLASAFQCAGTPTVVATLWNVRDEVAADFMGRFYSALAHGARAGRAQREAQSAMRAAGRGPGDWAAFVVWGSGDTRLPLKPGPAIRLMSLPAVLR